MGKHGVRWFVGAVALSFLLTGCAGLNPHQAYSDLEPEVLELVIADTADWAHGTPCDGFGDCDEIEDLSGMSMATWIAIDDVSPVGEVSDDVFTAARRDVGARYDSTSGEVSFTLRGSNLAQHLEEARNRGLQLWIGMPWGYGLADYPFGYVLAFDAVGRIGSIGHTSAVILSEPIAKLSLAAGVSPLEYFLSEMVSEPPQRVLTTTNPGLPSETFGPKRMIATNACITFGPRGATLVFPDGTVKERLGRGNVPVDVIDNWSGLDALPFKRLLEPETRLEIVGQQTTLAELDVAPAMGCPDTAIFVEEIRILPGS